jgi:hypothetical protein
MKTLKTITICMALSLGFLYSGAQEKLPFNQPDYNKPKIFDDLPKKINLKITDMDSLFDLAVGRSVMVKIAQNFHFKGTVVSKSGSSEDQVRSVVIKSNTKNNAAFTFTRIPTGNGSFVYRGRILSKESIDAYEIVKENDQYVLEKKNYYEMVRE